MTKNNQNINQICLIIIATVSVIAALVFTKDIFVPFVISFFIYSSAIPAMNFIQEKLKLSKTIAIIIISTIFLSFIFGISLFAVNSIGTFTKSANIYDEKISLFVTESKVLIERFGIDMDLSEIQDHLKELPIGKIFQKISGGFISIVGNIVLILILTLFLLSGENKPTQNPMLADIKMKISKYISTKFLTSFVTAFLVGIIFMCFSVDLAILFALLTFLLNFIPSIGSIIATLVPVPILFLQFGLSFKFAMIIIICGIIQMVIGNVIEPKIMGENMDLHPITILLFLIFWGLVWGIPGMFLAVPITAIVKIIFSKIEVTKPISELLSGRLPSK